MADHHDTDAQTCGLHGTLLTIRPVSISYGLLIPDPAWEVAPTLFPNSRSYVGGGCVLGSETHMMLPVCDDCRQAESKWRLANGLSDPFSKEIKNRLNIDPYKPKD